MHIWHTSSIGRPPSFERCVGAEVVLDVDDGEGMGWVLRVCPSCSAFPQFHLIGIFVQRHQDLLSANFLLVFGVSLRRETQLPDLRIID